jgi:hypothetical protein
VLLFGNQRVLFGVQTNFHPKGFDLSEHMTRCSKGLFRGIPIIFIFLRLNIRTLNLYPFIVSRISEKNPDQQIASMNTDYATIILDDFQLDRCFDESNSETHQIADIESWSSPPLPQKFPARTSKGRDTVSKSSSRKLTAHYKKQSCRAIGAMISREEAAHWSSSEEEVQRAVCTVADLLIMNHL